MVFCLFKRNSGTVALYQVKTKFNNPFICITENGTIPIAFSFNLIVKLEFKYKKSFVGAN